MQITIQVTPHERASRTPCESLLFEHPNHTKDLLIDAKILAKRIARRKELPRRLCTKHCHWSVRLDVMLGQISTPARNTQVCSDREFRHRSKGLAVGAKRSPADFTANGLQRHDEFRVGHRRLKPTRVLVRDAISRDECAGLRRARGIGRF